MRTKVYFDLSDDILEILNENGLSIGQILENEGIEVPIEYGIRPSYEGEPARTKDLVAIAMLVAASSGLLTSIAYAINKTLNTIYNKPHLVSFLENEELRDANGNILLDKEGNPIFKINKKYQLVESQENLQNEKIEFKSGLKDGIVIKFESKSGKQ